MMNLTAPRPPPPPPPAKARGSAPGTTCHAVSRSAELLSCARTALRMAQERRKKAEEEGRDPAAESSSSGEGGDLPDFLRDAPPGALSLFSADAAEQSSAQASAADAIQLLSALDSSISDLGALVRRRGHTNDPTAEIDACCRSFQTYAKELVETAQQIRTAGTVPLHGRRSSAMRKRHYEYVADQIKKAGEKRLAKFKKVLEVRGEVIKDQNRRRRMLNPSTNKSGAGGSSGAASKVPPAPGSGNFSGAVRSGMSQLESPLFTMTGTSGSLAKPPGAAMSSAGSGGSNSINGSGPAGRAPARQHSAYAAPPPAPSPYGVVPSAVHSAPSSIHGNGSGANSAPGAYSASTSGYGGSYGGYGGGSDMGMRRRPNAAALSGVQQQAYPYRPENDPSPDADANTAEDMTAQIRARKAKRETKSRLEEARKAESKLAELTGMFGKMADLVVQQGETMTKIEDDVEAAHGDIALGQEEIVKVHAMTKGNRALILKVFGILIFFIVFMRFY